MPDANANHVQTVQLQSCPQCEYSLRGLPAQGRCPECGFVCDDQTFQLRGIARGVSTMTTGRKMLWIFVGIGGVGGPQLGIELALFNRALSVVVAAFGAIWLAALIYLIATGKRERRGMEPFLFAAGGFGSCAGHDPSTPVETRLTAWSEVNVVRFDRKSANWHRLRLGRGVGRGTGITDVRLDAVVRCNEAEVPQVRQRIETCIAQAHGHPPTESDAPPDVR